MALKIVGICGSLRARSFNLMALRAAGELMPDGMHLKVVSIADLPVYDFDIQLRGFPSVATRLRDEILEADGILFANPEYNWSVGAPLKNAIDWLSRFSPQPFLNKPAAVLSATTGPLGGARAQYDLRRILSGLGALWLAKPEIFIGNATAKFDEKEGALTDEVARKLIGEQMAAFKSWVEVMQSAFPS